MSNFLGYAADCSADQSSVNGDNETRIWIKSWHGRLAYVFSIMREIELAIPPGQTHKKFANRIVKLLLAEGLRISLKATLARHPGCTHWHFRHGNDSGTLELTVWPSHRRAWISIQSRREADWIDPIVQSVKAIVSRV